MAFNPNIINTSLPPPNFPMAPIQFQSYQMNPCPTPPTPQQHMFNTGMHVPVANPSSFSAVPPNHLPSPSPIIGLGFAQNPMQTSSPMWNNNNMLNSPMVNNQNHNFPNAPPPNLAKNNQIVGSFQAPFPPADKQFQASGWSNSINHPPNNHNGLLAIAPLPSSGNNQHNRNNYSQNFTEHHVPVRSDIKLPTAQLDVIPNRNNHSSWSNNNKPFRPPSSHQVPVNHNRAGDSNQTWNPLQKTSVPDSSIFQNPNAIFNMTGNNFETVNSGLNNVAKNTFPDHNANNRLPLNQTDVIPSNRMGKFNFSFEDSNASFNSNTITSNNKSPDKPTRFFQQSNNFNTQHVKKFHQNNLEDSGMQNSNFKSSYSEGQNIQSFHQSHQNLIGARVASNKNTFDGRHSNRKFFQSNNLCRSNSVSSNIEEYTISDSESIESANSKNSPQKYQKNKRVPDNLQKVKSEFTDSRFENKMTWMTESIQKALQKRNMLFKQARTTNDPAVWDEYNKLKNEINRDIQQAKLSAKNNRPKVNTPKVWQDKGKKLPFNCDTCDRGFPSQEELRLHMALHIKCHHSGCNFEAHPKIVSLHQRMQHDTGYADVINKLQNDEEIKKWREERRRRFPTAENILKKKAEQAEKEARGEVIEEKNYGQFKRRRFEDRNKDHFSNRPDRKNRKRKRNHKHGFQKAPEIDLAQDSESEEESGCLTKLPKFRGMKSGLEDLLVNDIKTEETVDAKSEVAEDIACVQGSEVSLNQTALSSEHQDLDEDDDAPLEIPIQKVSLNDSSDSADENDHRPLFHKDQQELLDEAAAEDPSSGRPNGDEKSNTNEKSSFNDNKGNKRERNEKRCRPPVPPRPKNSLLQMLLSDEIRHERNVIMQCVRHIVRNNFFGIETNM